MSATQETIDLLPELLEIPAALRALVQEYRDGERLDALNLRRPLLTGMGASYHAAWIGAVMLRRAGVDCQFEEAADLLHYSPGLARQADPLVYLSQSGGSGEVAPTLALLDDPGRLVAITNDTASPLARGAGLLLPMAAGSEAWIAGKTYGNTLALLWLLAQRKTGADWQTSLETILRLADRAEQIQHGSAAAVTRLEGLFAGGRRVIFLGHGPHAATAREAAMTLAEWPKLAACSYSVAAFRHGFIESAGRGAAVVLFSAAGVTQDSTLALGRELQGYGLDVLRIEHGQVLALGDAAATGADELLSPLEDMLPVQLLAEAMARKQLVSLGFRYIRKIVSNI